MLGVTCNNQRSRLAKNVRAEYLDYGDTHASERLEAGGFRNVHIQNYLSGERKLLQKKTRKRETDKAQGHEQRLKMTLATGQRGLQQH